MSNCFHIKNVAASHNSLRLAEVVLGNTVHVGNNPRPREIGVINSSYPCKSLEFSSDGCFVAICSKGSVDVHEIDPLAQIATYQGNSDGVQAAAFSLDGRFLAAALSDRTHIWDMDSQTLRGNVRLHGAKAVAFLPDGQMLVGSMSLSSSYGIGPWRLASAC
jgi:WD40 repeat protein